MKDIILFQRHTAHPDHSSTGTRWKGGEEEKKNELRVKVTRPSAYPFDLQSSCESSGLFWGEDDVRATPLAEPIVIYLANACLP